jgi:membrane fusion protein, heavy metal efflux system
MNSKRQKQKQGPSLNWPLAVAAIFVALLAAVTLAFWRPSTKDAVESLTTAGIEDAGSVIRRAEATSSDEHASETDHDHEGISEGTAANEDRVAAVKKGLAETSENERDHGHPDNASDLEEDHVPADEDGAADSGHDSELSPEKLQRLGIEVAVADNSPVALELERPAEVKFDSDYVVHIVPRVAGVVSQVDVSQGQVVEKDQLLAVIQSRELAELKAEYLADVERLGLARENFEREKRLWEKKITSEKDYLAEKSALAEANIALTVSQQKLRALGFSHAHVDTLRDKKNAELTTYEIRTPIAGTVIERHLSLGEAVSTETDVFMVAETSSVWVDITVYPEDLPSVSAGQAVRIDPGSGDVVEGRIAFVTANVHEETRTAVARVIIDSAGGRLKPGMFVKALIEVGEETAGVRLPKAAIQSFNNSPVVFVQEGENFEPRPVKIGRENSKYVQVLSGVSEGDSYVAEGAFTLKALIQKSQIGEGHAH